MRLIYGLLLCSNVLLTAVNAEVAPDFTPVIEGYNLIAKLPCLGCPFLYQDTSSGQNAPWTTRKDDNALLLNISIPFDRPSISVNQEEVWPVHPVLPRIVASQVVQDISTDDIASIVSSGQLETSHETSSGGEFFALSYSQSIHRAKDSSALVFRFDVFEIWSGLPEPPLDFRLEDPAQQVLEIVLLPRPVMSALEWPSPSYEIAKVSFVPRSKGVPPQETMHFRDWDSFGRKGTVSHSFHFWGQSVLDFVGTGLWALVAFLLAVMAVFVLICLFCIFGLDFWKDDYARAQNGKTRDGRSGTRGKGWGSGDLEQGKVVFKSAEELGLLGRGKVVGLGKSD